MKKTQYRWKRITLIAALVILGLLGGYAYYYFVGCASGTCAISSNPYRSTLYGGVIGLLLGYVLAPDSKTSCCQRKEP